MVDKEYLGRGIHKGKLWDALTLKSGALKPMLDVIYKDRNKLDVQIRNNYLNIYYQGGNIAMVSSANSVLFNKNYFYTGENGAAKDLGSEMIERLTQKRNELTQKFKSGNFKEYFDEAKGVMDKWIKLNQKPERIEQHQLSIENRDGKSDYTIIDIEYQVSTKSKFACIYKGRNGKIKKPRFDIIAVNKAGVLCVIELKKGSGALGGVSGLEAHLRCYESSIERNPKSFMAEMKKTLIQKQDFGLIDKRVKILASQPKFMFAYSYATEDKEKEDKIFEKYYNKLQVKPPVIKLNNGWVLKSKGWN